MASRKPDYGDGASPGKIFIGGLAKDTTSEQFVKYFGKYGEITDSVIMKDRLSGRPRGFGFITYADPSVVDTVIAEVHVINNKQVEIKRTIPKGSAESKDFKTKKIFVGGIPTSVSEDEFKSFFSKYGNVVEREIIRDHVSKRSRGFGFIVFESEQAVDTILADGNLVDMDGTQVEIKKAEPKKPSNPGPAAFYSEPRKRSYDDGFNGYDNSYSNFRGGGFGPAPYRSFGTGSFGHAPYRSVGTGGFGPAPHRSFGSRFGDYNGYSGGGASDFSGGYGDFPGGEYGNKFGDYGGYSGSGAANRFASYGGGGYGGGYGGGGLGAYGQGSGYDGYPGPGSGAGYEAGPGGSNGEAEGPYGGRSAYSGGGRYHPYGR